MGSRNLKQEVSGRDAKIRVMRSLKKQVSMCLGFFFFFLSPCVITGRDMAIWKLSVELTGFGFCDGERKLKHNEKNSDTMVSCIYLS